MPQEPFPCPLCGGTVDLSVADLAAAHPELVALVLRAEGRREAAGLQGRDDTGRWVT